VHLLLPVLLALPPVLPYPHESIVLRWLQMLLQEVLLLEPVLALELLVQLLVPALELELELQLLALPSLLLLVF
jgi:hypothetical protein